MQTITQVADQAGRPQLENPSAAFERLEEVVAELFAAMRMALGDDRTAAHACMARAEAILSTDTEAPDPYHEIHAAEDCALDPAISGLAPWQVRKIQAHIECRLDTALTVDELARAVKLSRSYFCRAFRRSFGSSPHAHLMRRRIERAQGLMLTTAAPLGAIALDCGLSDQSHFTRLFRHYVGETPAVWRRARATGSAASSSP